ncbi:MAG: hypothetical protein ACLS7Z_10580 [Christensenellales bacterium]
MKNKLADFENQMIGQRGCCCTTTISACTVTSARETRCLNEKLMNLMQNIARNTFLKKTVSAGPVIFPAGSAG